MVLSRQTPKLKNSSTYNRGVIGVNGRVNGIVSIPIRMEFALKFTKLSIACTLKAIGQHG
jgi:CheY-specific phosphatase CheX